MKTYEIFWTRADGQGCISMGGHDSREAAEMAIPDAEKELLGQCADDEPDQRKEILAGTWAVIG